MTLVRCTLAVADMLAAPRSDAERVSQCLFGERAEVLGRTARWYRVRNRRDGYEGHVRRDAFARTDGERGAFARGTASCIVGARATLLFAAPDIKGPVRLRLPFGAALEIDGDGDGPFARVPGGALVRPSGSSDTALCTAAGAMTDAMTDAMIGAAVGAPADAWVWRAHCLAAGETLAGTPVDVARRLFDGAPYLWGGRSPDGADCSGLVQGTAFALGLALPRDSAEQEACLGQRVAHADRAASDAVFWPGHVGLLLDRDTLFHATAHRLATALEPLADVVRRAGPPSSIRRLPLRTAPVRRS